MSNQTYLSQRQNLAVKQVSKLIKADKWPPAGYPWAQLAALPPEEERVPVQKYLEELDRLTPKGIPLWIGGGGAARVRRDRLGRELWIFESLQALESKLLANFGEAGKG